MGLVLRIVITVAAVVASFAGLSAGRADAGSIELYPVRVDLSAERSTATMKVRNTGGERITVEARLAAWTQAGGQDVYQPTRAVLASPPLFELAPGKEQVVRLGLIDRAPPAGETAYRIFLQELPDAAAANGGAVRTLLRISVPVFVSTPGAGGGPSLGWSARRDGGALVLEASNSGAAHARIHALTVGEPGRAPTPVAMGGYVLPGASRRFVLHGSQVPASSKTIAIEAQTEHGSTRATIPVQ